MAWFECDGCKWVFEDLPSTENRIQPCPHCNRPLKRTLYKSNVHEKILALERTNELLPASKQLETAQYRQKRLENLYEELRIRYNANCSTNIKNTKARQDAILSELSEATRSVKKAQIIRDNAETTRDNIEKGAKTVYNQANDKNKLYIGNRQYVSGCVKDNAQKRARILDCNVWSWGLNAAWVEGGIDAKAHFKIKVNTDDQFASLPPAAIEWLTTNAGPDRSGINIEEKFLEMCKAQGRGTMLWYTKDGADRATWTALEICCMLRRGYRFAVKARKPGKKGEKLYLIPPH